MSKEKTELGSIRITVQRADRLKAITELSVAIRCVAEALNQSPEVSISNCVMSECSSGIVIDVAEDVTATGIFPDGC